MNSRFVRSRCEITSVGSDSRLVNPVMFGEASSPHFGEPQSRGDETIKKNHGVLLYPVHKENGGIKSVAIQLSRHILAL